LEAIAKTVFFGGTEVQSFSTPLNSLHDDGSWFARAHELRLWVVRCDANLRKTALKLVPQLEFHADNHCAWPVLAHAHMASDDGWQVRANVLVADWARRVTAFAEAGVAQAEVDPAAGVVGFAAFRATLAAILEAMVEPLRGLVVVLAPTIVQRPDVLEEALMHLLADSGLQRARWVVLVDVDVPLPRRLLDALGDEHALAGEYRVDEAQHRRDLAAMLQASPARFGTAFPVGVEPPRRVDDPPPVSKAERDEALRAAGIDPVLLDVAPQIRAKVFGAALAMKDGQGREAIELQREARDLCASVGMVEMQVIIWVALASYLSGLDQRREAKRELLGAIELAHAHDLLRVESQAHLALGLLHGLDRAYPEAIHSYVDAAKTAEAGDEPTLAIEAWRMAGQLAAQIGQDDAAANALHEALRVATGVPVSAQKTTSAPEAARQLATIYQRHGVTAQAASLFAQADAMEAGKESNHVGE
jgi:tetratricopeptide (TPR) repeat protein